MKTSIGALYVIKLMLTIIIIIIVIPKHVFVQY